MSLTPSQILKLAGEIDANMDAARLTLLAARLNERPVESGTLKARAFELIDRLNRERPPRDRELLQAVKQDGNAALYRLANELLTPGFFPPGDPHRALMLGKVPFVGRDPLRDAIQEFTSSAPDFSSHVLIVSGQEPGGKSYTWHFLHHLARSTAGAEPIRLPLKGTSYTPREFLFNAMVLLGLEERSALPQLADSPQEARTSPLLNVFKGSLVNLKKPYWLVVDDLNEPGVSNEIRETALAMACAVEEIKPPSLWLALLGYNDDLLPGDLSFIAREGAEFPNVAAVAKFLKSIADEGGVGAQFDAARAQQTATYIFSAAATVDKATMGRINPLISKAGDNLRKGIVP